MPAIKISDFKGMSPRSSEKLLPEDFAQTANNCDLLRGKISAIKDFSSEAQTGNLITNPVTIYKFEDNWLSWAEDTDIVRSPLGTDTPRIYMSNGLAYPKQTSSRMTTLLGAYFTINAPTNVAPGTSFQTEFYVYITVGGVGPVPPVDAGKTTITAAILVGDTAAQAATKIASAIQAHALFGTATAAGTLITIENANIGNCVPPISDDCGFTASTTRLGALAVKQETTIDVNAGPDPTSGAGYPRATWRLGVPAPDEAMAITIVGDGDGYVVKSTNWIYTYVTAWGEESKPSPATETVDMESTPQKTQVSCETTDMLTLNVGVGRYFTFSTTASNYYCWYTIDDDGSDPAPAGIGIQVDLLRLDNPDQIADKIAAAINAVVGILCSATTDGKLITITNGVNGNVTNIGAATSDFSVAVTQAGTASLPEISTINTERLINGSYFILNTAVDDSYYVWYQIAAVPSITVDFTPQNVVEGDYFYFHLLFPELDPNLYKNPNVERKIVVYFEEEALERWVRGAPYVLNDVVWEIYINGEGNSERTMFRCNVANTTDSTPLPYNGDWTRNPGYPTGVEADKFIKAAYEFGAATDNEFAKPAYDAMVESTNGLNEVAQFNYDSATSDIEIQSLIIGDITSSPSADNGVASPNLSFTDSYGSTVSSDPGVPGKTGIEVDIVVDDVAVKIAEKTAEAINNSDAFSCAKPYSPVITIVNDMGGLADSAEDGNTAFIVSELQSGGVQTASFVIPAVPAANADVNISHVRLYRLVTADNGSAEYQYVPPYEPYDDDTVYAVGDYLSYSGYGYYCFISPAAGVLPTNNLYFYKLDTLDLPLDVALIDGISDGHPYDSTLAEVLSTEDWDMPPADLHGITLFDNGIMAGFSKNSVYVTEPLHPYVFPNIYSLLFPETIIGLGYMPGTIIVLTEGAPQGIIGNDPTTLSQTPFPYPQPCISKRGITMTENGVIYPCPNGLFMISQNGGSLITKSLYTKTQWIELSAEDFIGTYFDGKVFFSVDGSNTTAFIDFQETPFIVNFDHTLSDDKENYTYDMISDGDDLYYLFKKETAATYEIYKYRGGVDYKTFTWKSKKHQLSYLTNFACGRVIADWSSVVDSGNCDGIGATANVLKDSGQNFTSTVAIGMTVYNTTDSTSTTVTAVTSDTELALTADIMDDGDDYTISPDRTITVTLYVDGVLKQTFSATDSDVFRLVSGFIGRIFEIQMTGAIDVDFFGISQTPMDISL